MTTRCLFVVPFVAMLLIATMFNLPYFNPAQATNEELKQAGTATKAHEILRQWGDRGLTAARRNLTLDWFFIAVYVLTWIAAGRHFLPHLGLTKIAVAAGVAGALADIVENIALWKMLHGNVTPEIAQTCEIASKINVAFFLVAALYFMGAAIVTACNAQGS